MGKMLNAFLAIHGRCKFIIFLRGQTPSLSAPTLILSLMEHFQGKAKNTVKHSIKSTFSISIQLNCNWLPGNPQLPPYIYIHVMRYDWMMWLFPWSLFEFPGQKLCPLADRIYLYIYISISLYLYISTSLYIYVSMYLCIYVSMYLCIYISIYLYIYISIYLYLIYNVAVSISISIISLYIYIYISISISISISIFVRSYL